jgi:serine/threonine protein phosphatase PrpC
MVDVQSGGGNGVRYSAGAVQGWRKTMEDAHIADAETGVFAVFDGHGGKAVAKFAQSRFVKEFTSLQSFKEGNYKEALRESFHRIDELLEDPKFDALLKRYQAIPNPSERRGYDVEDDEFLEQEDGDENDDGNAKMALSSGAPTSGPKKKLTTAQAVQFFHQLLMAEANKRKGLPVVPPTIPTAASSSVDAPSSSSSSSSSSKAETDDDAPASIQTPQGPVCNLNDHRVASGCTAVVAFKVGQRLYVANAGDSRCCLCRGGVAVPLSEDHKPQSETERSRIEAAGGFVSLQGRVNGNLNLSRSLGDLKYKQVKRVLREGQMITAEPDVTVTDLVPQDRFFVLACDGVWDIMSCQQICDFVSERLNKGMGTVEIIDQIFQRCIADDIKTSGGLGGDNQTCVIVLLNE